MSKKCKKAWLWRSKDKNARKKNCKKKLSEINTGKKKNHLKVNGKQKQETREWLKLVV